MLSMKNVGVTGASLLLATWLAWGQSPPALTPSSAALTAPSAASQEASNQGPQDILSYISHGWDSLTRSLTNCETFEDVKSTAPPVLYLPDGFSTPSTLKDLEKNCRLKIAHLPRIIRRPTDTDVNAINPQGLLYLEHPYVVPGGRFNEMYGWDSYFIIRGLLRDGRPDLARGMVENFFFEVEHYGMVLNANRTYYLTRSQPPFLTSMILAVYDSEKDSEKDREKAAGRGDLAWLARAYAVAVKDYEFWMREPHLASASGLSRYYDFGNGPAPEVLAGTEHYYRYVSAYFLRHPEEADGYLVRYDSNAPPKAAAAGPQFEAALCESGAEGLSKENCTAIEGVGLSDEFYKGDRSTRESGFDVSYRFGPFGADTHHYAPVCLNSLLYKTEKDLQRISLLLGREQEAQEWERRAAERRPRIDKYFWNEKRGLYFDYEFVKGRQSSYEFATTFYPLWAGLASQEQAKAVSRSLGHFAQAGGLATSRRETKAQWDFPYGWAPLQLIAVEGLRRYGFTEEANRLAYAFLLTVVENFRRDGTIREKYNVVTRSSDTQVEAGYTQNVVGFGWTNGVFLELWHGLPEPWRERLEKATEMERPSPVLQPPGY
jgi:alpha,alpha-trehalase